MFFCFFFQTRNADGQQVHLQKAEESNWQHPLDHRIIPKKTSISNSLTMLKAFDCVDHNTLWKILKEMGIPYHLISLLENFHAGQEATVRIWHGIMEWFKIGKEVHQGCIFSPCYFNLYAEYIMWNAELDHKLESRLPGEILTTSDMQMIRPRARHPVMWSQGGLRKHHYEQS